MEFEECKPKFSLMHILNVIKKYYKVLSPVHVSKEDGSAQVVVQDFFEKDKVYLLQLRELSSEITVGKLKDTEKRVYFDDEYGFYSK